MKVINPFVALLFPRNPRSGHICLLLHFLAQEGRIKGKDHQFVLFFCSACYPCLSSPVKEGKNYPLRLDNWFAAQIAPSESCIYHFVTSYWRHWRRNDMEMEGNCCSLIHLNSSRGLSAEPRVKTVVFLGFFCSHFYTFYMWNRAFKLCHCIIQEVRLTGGLSDKNRR